MDERDRIREQLRRSLEGEAWHGPALLEILEGVDAGMAAVRPLPEVHTIEELVLHVTTWMRVVRERVEGRWREVGPDEDFPPPSGTPAGWKRSRNELRSAAASLDRAVERCAPEALHARLPHGGHTLVAMLDGVIQHNLYHAGQMAILKKAALGP